MGADVSADDRYDDDDNDDYYYKNCTVSSFLSAFQMTQRKFLLQVSTFFLQFLWERSTCPLPKQ